MKRKPAPEVEVVSLALEQPIAWILLPSPGLLSRYSRSTSSWNAYLETIQNRQLALHAVLCPWSAPLDEEGEVDSSFGWFLSQMLSSQVAVHVLDATPHEHVRPLTQTAPWVFEWGLWRQRAPGRAEANDGLKSFKVLMRMEDRLSWCRLRERPVHEVPLAMGVAGDEGEFPGGTQIRLRMKDGKVGWAHFPHATWMQVDTDGSLSVMTLDEDRSPVTYGTVVIDASAQRPRFSPLARLGLVLWLRERIKDADFAMLTETYAVRGSARWTAEQWVEHLERCVPPSEIDQWMEDRDPGLRGERRHRKR